MASCGFLGWRNISLVLLCLRWIPMSGEFMTSYLLVDSLTEEVSIYNSITSTHLIIFSF